MPSSKDQHELNEIIGEVRTHLEYLSELGVEEAREFAGLNIATRVREQKTSAAAEPKITRDPVPQRTAVASRPEPPQVPSARLADLPRLGTIRSTRPATTAAPPPASKPSGDSSISVSALFADGAGSSELPVLGETMADIHNSVGDCTRCPLHEGRKTIVHTEGNPNARLMFVGEAPGADEDAQARPFVGRAGQLLNKIIEAIGLRRDEVLIGNINRCRPPGNRPPTPDEVAACKPFLLREIGAVRPEVIVVLGNTAMKNLLGSKEGITKVRGIFQDFHGIKVMPTFHPAYLLRDPSKKRETWDDLKKVRDYLARAGS